MNAMTLGAIIAGAAFVLLCLALCIGAVVYMHTRNNDEDIQPVAFSPVKPGVSPTGDMAMRPSGFSPRHEEQLMTGSGSAPVHKMKSTPKYLLAVDVEDITQSPHKPSMADMDMVDV